MATDSLSELIKSVQVGEDGDEAYRRLYGSQTKPCDFRRWFATVQRGEPCVEVSDDVAADLKQYVDDGMTVEEAFLAHCPEYVGPGEFSVAYDKELKSRRPDAQKPAAASAPKPVKVAAKPVTTATPAAQGEYEGIRSPEQSGL